MGTAVLSDQFFLLFLARFDRIAVDHITWCPFLAFHNDVKHHRLSPSGMQMLLFERKKPKQNNKQNKQNASLLYYFFFFFPLIMIKVE